jgi:hypothetical protein
MAPPVAPVVVATESAAPGGGFGRLVAAIVVAAVVSGAVTVLAPQWQPLLGLGGRSSAPDAVPALQQDVAALSEKQNSLAAKTDLSAAMAPMQDEIGKLKASLDQLSQSPAQPASGEASGNAVGGTAVPPADLTALNDKVAALESSFNDLQEKLKAATVAAASQAAPAAPAPDLSPEVSALKIENQALRDQITTLSGKIDSFSKDDLGKVDESLGAVSQRVSTLEAQVAAQPAPVTARQQLATATVLAIGQLQSRLAGTDGFAGELTALKQLAGSDAKLGGDLDPVIDKLMPVASDGAPTLSQLQATLPVTDIARAAEAEQAGDLASDTGWWQRMTHRLAEIVTVRPVGEDVTGDGPLERLARAEAALKRGDLSKSTNEIAGLSGEPARRAASWLAQAQARLTLDAASASLSDVAARQLAPATSSSN